MNNPRFILRGAVIVLTPYEYHGARIEVVWTFFYSRFEDIV
jgi:hypothetical protein